MARPLKDTVDFFPHYVKAGRTIFILESKFGNDGYAFWFKLLEILGESEGHSYDCSNSANWAFLLARTRCDEKTAEKIIQTLIDLGKVDSELWGKRIIWVQHLVDNLSDVYRRRQAKIPQKPDCGADERESSGISGNGNAEETEFRGTETAKEEKRREKKSIIYPCQGICDLWNSVCVSLPKIAKLTEARKKKIKTRLDEFGCQPEEYLATAEALFRRVQASDFLTGRRTEWKASFDWLFDNGKNWVKVAEGNYDNNKGGVKQSATASDGSQLQLGAGEFIAPDGRRTYGTGTATIPVSAPPRPSERHAWDAATANWILL